MTHNKPKVNPYHVSVALAVEAAYVASYNIILVKKPVRFVRDSILAKISWLLRYTAEKSAHGFYYALRSIVNNRLTRYISPSVSSLDSKIENVCSTSGKSIGNVLAFPGILAFFLIAASYATSISLVGALVCNVLQLFVQVKWVFRQTIRETKKELLNAKMRADERYENVSAKAPYMALQVSFILLVYAVVLPAIGLFIYTLYQVCSFTCALFFTPVYMLSSVLRLDNRFNIYGYESGIGVVHGYIQDLLARRHDGGCYFPNYVKTGLIAQATTGDLDATSTPSTAPIPTKLQYAELKHSARHQSLGASA